MSDDIPPSDQGDDNEGLYWEHLAAQLEVYRHQVPDPLLCWYIAFSLEGDRRAPVTLQVGGTIISGKIVSPGEYFDRQAATIDHWTSVVGDEPDALSPLLREHSALEQLRDVADGHLRFVNLADARVFAGKWSWSSDWRIRLVDVNGWFLGSYSTRGDVLLPSERGIHDAFERRWENRVRRAHLADRGEEVAEASSVTRLWRKYEDFSDKLLARLIAGSGSR